MIKVTELTTKRYTRSEDFLKYLDTEKALTVEDILVAWSQEHSGDVVPSYSSIVTTLEDFLGNRYKCTKNNKTCIVKKGFGVGDYRKYFYLKEVSD